MKTCQIYVLFIILLLKLFPGTFAAFAGDWRQHFAFNNSFSLVETPSAIFAATSMGLIKLDKQSLSLTTLTKVNYLSDHGISTVNYISNLQSIIVGYENGNIDIIRGNSIININDLKIHPLDGSKRVNHVHVIENRAYCATDFGIMVINLERSEVEATYFIGDNATNLRVHQLASDNNFLYAATSSGVLRVPLDARDKHVYHAWTRVSPDNGEYFSIAPFLTGVVAARGRSGQSSTLFHLTGASWHEIATIPNFRSLRASNNQLIATSDNEIRFYGANFQPEQVITGANLQGTPLVPAFRDAFRDASGTIWIADFNAGLLSRDINGNFRQFLPGGPATNQVHQVKFIGNRLWLVPGGITTTWNNSHTEASVSILDSRGWINLSPRNTPALAGAEDFLSITPNPRNHDNVFINSWGSGIFELMVENNTPVVINHFFTPPNGIQNVFADDRRFVRISYSAFDSNNVMWVLNSSVNAAIVAYYPTENLWMRYDYGIPANMQGLTPLLITSWGDFWLPIIREGGIPKGARGIFIWNNNNTPKDQRDDRYRGAVPQALDPDTRNQGQILLWDEDGMEITNSIFSIIEDKNGHIWLGTDRGIVIQYNPRNILTRPKPVFTRLLVPRRDGSGLADFLLGNEVVTAMAVDPANRKWLGTQGNGVSLVSEDGTREIHAFNTNNSPLPSNFITSITIDEITGEVFFATSGGLVSFKGSAIRGSEDYSGMYAFPNPVRPGFRGQITITGLVNDTNIKITTSSGKLVYETTSIGGQAFWDGNNLWGEPVVSGVYLIFAATTDGTQSKASKIAIIR